MKRCFGRKNFTARYGALVSILFAIVFASAFFVHVGCKGKDGKASGPNLLLITIEGMRGDMSGPNVAKPMEMPVLDRLWRLGTVLTRVIVTSPQRTPSISSIFTGLYPVRHGVRNDSMERLAEDVTTLAEVLREAGWRSGAVVSNSSTVAVSGLAQGFEYFDDGLIPYSEDFGLPRRRWTTVAKASSVTTRAIGWMKGIVGSKRPWFLWVEYSDALPPRNPPSPFREMFPDNRYAASLAFVDANLGVLLGKLHDLGLLNNTLLIITSAHGLPLGDHGESVTSVFAYLSSISVPAVVVFPGKIPTNRVVKKVVSSVDLMPTILGLMNVSAPKKIDGEDISKAMLGTGDFRQRTVYNENAYLGTWYNWRPVRSIISGNLHFLDMNPPELYNIEADPQERKNIAGQDKINVEKPAGELRTLLEGLKSRGSFEKSAVEAEVEEKLRRLGYLPDSTGAGDMSGLSKKEILVLLSQTRSALGARTKRDFASAEEKHRKMVKRYPYFSLSLYRLAMVLQELGAPGKETEKLFKNAMVGGSRYIRAAAMTRLAMLYMAGNQMVEAENLLKLASRLVPDNAAIYNELGQVYLAQKLGSEAERAFRKALQVEPRFYRAHFGLALLYVNDPERIQAAAEELARVLEYNPDFVPARFMLARIAAEYYKNKEEAGKHLKKVIEINPEGKAAQNARDLLEKLEAPR